jgi:hypothetical protein
MVLTREACYGNYLQRTCVCPDDRAIPSGRCSYTRKISPQKFQKILSHSCPFGRPWSTVWTAPDECQILCIWTPWFTLVRPLALLFSDALVSFCVFMFCRSIREEWQKSWGIAWKIWKFWNSEVLKILDRTYFYRSAPEHPISSFSMTKNSSPSDFRSRTRWFHDLGCL